MLKVRELKSLKKLVFRANRAIDLKDFDNRFGLINKFTIGFNGGYLVF